MSEPQAVYIHPDCDIRLLVCAVVEDAKRHAAKGDRDARQWLKTEGAAWIDALFDIHADHTKRWAAGRRKPARRKMDPRRWDKYKSKPKPAQLVTA